MDHGRSGKRQLISLTMIVDAFHYCNHHVKDWLCRMYCNPVPLDGSAPNLVIEVETDKGAKYLKRAFNTQASE